MNSMPLAKEARLASGLSIEQAARRVRVSTKYLERVERHGGASFPLAQRLARAYQCSISVFLKVYSKKRRRKEQGALT